MKILRPGNAGLSRIELICIIILIVVAIGLAIAGMMYYKHSLAMGDDAMKANACERVATVNLLDTGCVVSNCDRPKTDTDLQSDNNQAKGTEQQQGGDTQTETSSQKPPSILKQESACEHQVGNITIGYWDAVEKKVLAEKPEGYNEYHKMKIGKTAYEGKVNTLVIKVEGKGDKVKLSWVFGAK